MITNRDLKVFLIGAALVGAAWIYSRWDEPTDLASCRCALSKELRMNDYYREERDESRTERDACLQGCKK